MTVVTLLAHAGEATETGEMMEMMQEMMGRGGVGWRMMGPWMMGGGWSQTMGAGWMWLGSLIWLATWILVIAVLVALLRWLWKKGNK